MKRYYSSIVGIFVTLVLIASLAVPTSIANPTPASAASPSSMMQWWPVDTPDSLQQVTASLYSPVVGCTETGSELVKLLVGVNGNTMYVIYSISAAKAAALPPGYAPPSAGPYSPYSGEFRKDAASPTT